MPRLSGAYCFRRVRSQRKSVDWCTMGPALGGAYECYAHISSFTCEFPDLWTHGSSYLWTFLNLDLRILGLVNRFVDFRTGVTFEIRWNKVCGAANTCAKGRRSGSFARWFSWSCSIPEFWQYFMDGTPRHLSARPGLAARCLDSGPRQSGFSSPIFP